MASFFISYEPVQADGNASKFKADINAMGEVVLVHESLLMLNTVFDSTEAFNMLLRAAGDSVRFVAVPVEASASLMNVRAGVVESFKRFIGK